MSENMTKRYDVAILGTGPAGISAAITLTIRNKKVILFGNKDLSTKLSKAHEIQNYPGFPAIKGDELQKNFLRHLDSLGISITEDQITSCYSMGDYFNLLSKKNEMFEAKAVIIATGVNFGKPYDGEEQFLGRGVSYCATCDAPLYKGKTAVIIGQSPKEEEEVKFMTEICSKVTYIPIYKDDVKVSAENLEVVHDVPLKIEGALKAQKLVLKEREISADGIFILRDSVSPSQLVPGLALDGNHIAVNRKMETNIKGCFACGDIAGTPYQYIKAAGEGNVAALSVVSYLA